MYSPQILKTTIVQILLAGLCVLLLECRSTGQRRQCRQWMYLRLLMHLTRLYHQTERPSRFIVTLWISWRISVRTILWVIDADGKSVRQISKGFDAVGAAAFTQVWRRHRLCRL